MEKEIISEAIRLIDNGWTQGAFARNANDEIVFVTNPYACKFCAQGALERAVFNITGKHYYQLDEFLHIKNFLDIKCKGGLVGFNDTENRSKEEVIAIFESVKEIYASPE